MRPNPRRRSGLLILAALAGVTCTDAPTAPHAPDPATAPRQAQLALAPAFSREAVQAYGALPSFGFSITNVRVTLQRPGGGVVVDTIVQVAPGQTEISLQLTVPVQGNQTDFDALVQLRDGNQVLFQGTRRVSAQVGAGSRGTPPPSPDIPISYVGPGAAARALRIVPRDTTIATGASIGFTAQAVDGAGQPVANAVIRWSLADSTLGSIGVEDGTFRAAERRGTARVIAQLPNGVSDQAQVRIVPPPSQLLLVSGGGQSGVVGRPLAAPIVVEVRATDGVPVAGEVVAFTASAGASVSSASVTTDSAGRAAITLTLGRTPGTYSVTATTGRLTPLSATATATVGTPARMSVQSGSGQVGRVGSAVPAPLVVRVADEFDNPVSGAVVTWAVTSGSGAVTQAATTTGSDGTSAVGYTFGTRPGEESVTATIATARGPVAASFALTAQVGLPASLRILDGASQTVTPGTTLAPFTVGVFDAFGNPVPGAVIAWTVTAGRATLSVARSIANAAGEATSTATAGSAAGSFTVIAGFPTPTGLPGGPIVEFRATVRAGSATSLAAVSGGGQSGTAGSVAEVPLVVRVRDAFGNAVSGATVRWSATSGSVSPAAATSDANGVAQAMYTFGTAVGSATVTATLDGATGTTGTVQFSMTTQADSPAAIVRVSGNAQSRAAGSRFAPFVVRVNDAFGNPVAGATVTWTLAQGSGALLLASGSTAADGTASSTFTAGGAAGTVRVVASLGNGTSAPAVEFTGTVTAGAAALIHRAAGDAQVGSPNTAVPIPPAVKVTDAFGNAVPGVAVTFVVAAGGGSVSGATDATDASGIASVGSWTLGSSGAQLLTAQAGASISTELRALVLPPGVTKGWFGGTPDAESHWDHPGNWNEGGPPGLADKVFIPGWAHGHKPKLFGRREVLDLLIESAADAGLDLNGNELTVHGKVEAHGAGVFGSGRSMVRLAGGAKTLRGLLAVPTVSIESDVSLDGGTTFGGAVAVGNGGRLRVGAQQAEIAGDLSVVGNDAYLLMQDTASTLKIGGSLLAGGGNHVGLLTAGTLEIGGDFTEANGANEAFQASDRHLTRFPATRAHTISFAHDQSSWFNELEIAASADVTFVSNAKVNANLTNNGNFSVAAGKELKVEGTLNLNDRSTANAGGSHGNVNVSSGRCDKKSGATVRGNIPGCPGP